MEFQNSISWGLWSSADTLLLMIIAMILSVHASASVCLRPNETTDQIALLEFKRQISDDPYGVLNSWNDSQHHCQWQGVTCGTRHQRVKALNLSGMSLFGYISPRIGNLSFIRIIQLQENKFHGEIPQEIGNLFRLRLLNLSRNTLTGEIPVNLSSCQELRILSLSRNWLEGKIPAELGSLKKLVRLDLFTNNLTGEIPSSFGNMSSLTILSLAYNYLEGNLPKELAFLKNLFSFSVAVNRLSGMIPPSIYNSSAIIVFTVTSNFFHGNLPADIDRTLPNLQTLEIYDNHFYGHVPSSVANLSKLEILEVGENKFQGQVPPNLGNLPNLWLLNIEGNLLGSNSAGDLSFLASLTNCSNLQKLAFDSNNFGGELPNVIGNLSSQLTQLFMDDNHISGAIPVGFGRLVNLFMVNLEENNFLGVIPSEFVQLQNLQYLSLRDNFLSGQIPSGLCNITSLYALGLSANNFEGDITRSLENCRYVEYLDVSQNNLTGTITPHIFGMQSSSSLVRVSFSHNSLSGSLPLEIGNLINLNAFDASYNNFSGGIPSTLGDCPGLEYLDLRGNNFQGTIPPGFASLKAIQYLDLSSNNLTGQVPRDLENLVFLSYLNISFNDFEGEIPRNGVFGNASAIALVGNSKLCGGIPELRLQPCLNKGKKIGKHLVTIVTSTIFAAILISIALMFYLVIYRKKDTRKDSSALLSKVDKILRVSYHELYRATEGFSPANLIGSGSFGLVYKGRLNQHEDRLVAVKVLDATKNQASKSFKAECSALRNIRHRNLVSLLTYCCSIDFKGHEFKALVYEFMQNGSLDMWLHPEIAESRELRNLNLLQRLNIAIDVASALEYLHNYSEVAIVHCDLKPSNILLDNDLTAHVGDFGLARLLPKMATTSQQGTSSSSVAIKGSIGYAAPEYGMGLEPSTQGDVYSYGILLLEMFTGRRPTSDTFMDGLDLHNFVKVALPEQVWKIVDPLLLPREEEQDAAEDEEINDGEIVVENNGNHGNWSNGADNVQKCLISIFKVGLGCSQRSAKDRIDTKEVTRQLHLIRDACFS